MKMCVLLKDFEEVYDHEICSCRGDVPDVRVR